MPWVTCTTGREPSSSGHQVGSGACEPEAEIGPAKWRVAGASERGYSNSATVNWTIASADRAQSRTGNGSGPVVQIAEHVVGERVGRREQLAGESGEHGVAEPSERAGERGDAHAVGGGVAAGDRQRQHAAHDQWWPDAERMAEEEGTPGERRIGEDHIGRRRSMRGHHGVVLGPARPDEDVLDVERDRLGALQRGALGEYRVPVPPVVEVGIRRQRHMLGTGRLNDPGEPRSGQEPHPVAAFDEVSRDRQQRCDVPVDRHRSDDDRRHDELPRSSPWPWIGRCPTVFTCMRQ